MNDVVLSLGSNIGDKFFYLKEAIRLLNLKVGKVEKISSVYETEPWGMECDDAFYNIAVALQTELNPQQLLKENQQIEKELGRVRSSAGYASRTIDIDILFFNEEVIDTEDLIIPHPYIQKRNFVLAPLAEILPEFLHPVLNKNIKYLFEHSLDDCASQKIDKKLN
ncbi:2-amino-4-hydroxy-6-hydroxymethyldihydropteridine diphosphokinase [Bacteroidales bacterium OttesenSCG-928-C19]|nr:2-amino-4-hydroxy-6-hydroxymethyldihydropteridine diphosphokinase [Bacteroidales bacterium OttesenSCG-928-C19]